MSRLDAALGVVELAVAAECSVLRAELEQARADHARAIAERDTLGAQRDRARAERNIAVAARDDAFERRSELRAERDALVAERDEACADAALSNSRRIALERAHAALDAAHAGDPRTGVLERIDALVAERDRVVAECYAMRRVLRADACGERLPAGRVMVCEVIANAFDLTLRVSAEEIPRDARPGLWAGRWVALRGLP